MAAAAEAESGWTLQKTKEGKPFFWKTITKESVWQKPDGFQAEKQPVTEKKVENSSEPDQPTLRVRKYQDAPGERWQVFFRPKHKPLQTMRISEELWKHYPGVTDVTKLHQNKLRATVNNPKEANAIVCDPRFCIEYRVWIPARSVEIDGVVSENGLTEQQVLKAVGHFKRRNLPTIPVIEVRQMGTSEGEGASKRFVPSSSYRVTFAGTTLPDFLVVDNMLRLPVRMYRPRVMSCSNCKKLGHTKAFCSNKTVCGKCGEKHPDEQCQKEVEKCLLCGGQPHEVRSCPKYKAREDKLKRELERRSKRSFADMVKTVTTSAGSENPFSVLSEEEDGSPEDGTEDELIINTKSGTPKRKRKTKKTSNSDKFRTSTLPQPGSDKFNKAFPGVNSIKTLPKDPTNPAAVVPQKNHGKDHRIPFSLLLEAVLSVVSGSTRTLLEPLIPFFKELGKILSDNSALNAIISFD